MLLLAAVPDVQFHKLRRAAGSRFNVAQVSTWDDVLTSIRGRPVELAVVDPLLSGQGRSQEIERLRVLFPSLPLMLYTTLTPRTAGVLLALGQRGIQHAVFANYDDHPSRLREVLGQEEARSSSRQLLDQLGDAQTRLLQLHARAYLGLTAGEMRLSLDSNEALARVVQRFLTPLEARASAS